MTEQVQPLTGIKVADFSWFGAGPICAENLATFGATVVRVESEAHLDGLRGVGPFPPGKNTYNVSGYFNNYNAGKLDLTLNLNTDLGKRMALKLIAWCDVFITNFTPRIVEKWALTYDDLVKINPAIIAAYQPMQGFDGPHKHVMGFGAVLGPITGYSYLSGFPDRPPMGLGTNYPDYVINPGHTLVAILAALHYRRRTGKGQRIELAQIESSVAPHGPAILDDTANGRVQMRAGNRLPHAAPHGAFRCRDGTWEEKPEDRWIALGVFNDVQWSALVQAMGSPPWASDAKFATHAARKQHEDELEGHVTAWTRDQVAEHVMVLLQAKGIPAGVVQNARDMLDGDEHMKSRGYYVYLDHPEAGRTAYDGPPFVLSKTPGVLRSPAPLLGQHNEQVCKEILGMTDDEIADAIIAQALY
ncbi:MAG TPA: CoA transferase [Dehalococcoidia bacterium]|nr:CoA transferase [Dehalococcoidia bacterium]